MKTTTATRARANLYRLIDEVSDIGEPLQITGRDNNAVLVSETDWRSIEETLYLLSIPRMRESIRRGLKTPLNKTFEEPGW
ncbi:MAG: type II toxin-antitoxin system Phd/YefM family antitoxin [Acidobacteriota bacterium]